MRWCVLAALTGCLPGPDVGALQAPNDGTVVIGDVAAGCNNDSDPNTLVSYSADLVSGVFVRGKCRVTPAAVKVRSRAASSWPAIRRCVPAAGIPEPTSL